MKKEKFKFIYYEKKWHKKQFLERLISRLEYDVFPFICSKKGIISNSWKYLLIIPPLPLCNIGVKAAQGNHLNHAILYLAKYL